MGPPVSKRQRLTCSRVPDLNQILPISSTYTESLLATTMSQLSSEADGIVDDTVLDCLANHLRTLANGVSKLLDERNRRRNDTRSFDLSPAKREMRQFDSSFSSVLGGLGGAASTNKNNNAALDDIPPVQVFALVADSGFLKARELCRLLLLTSKSISDGLGTDLVYSQICKHRWKSADKIATSVRKSRGFKWLQTELSKPANRASSNETSLEHLPKLLPPVTTPASYELFVHICNGEGDETFSRIVLEPNIRELFESGSTKIPIECRHEGSNSSGQKAIAHFPRRLGRGTSVASATTPTSSDIVPLELEQLPNFDKWKAQIHLFRLDNETACCIHDSREVWPYFRERVVMNRSKESYGMENVGGNYKASVSAGSVRFSPVALPFDLTDAGKALEMRIREYDRQGSLQAFEGIYFEAILKQELRDHPTDANQVEMFTASLKLELWSAYEYGGDIFDSRKESSRHGVTALHLLENIKMLASGTSD